VCALTTCTPPQHLHLLGKRASSAVQASRPGRRKLRGLEALHASHLEQRSVTLASATAQFERDKLLYYKAIPDPAVSLDFQTTLRGELMTMAADDAPARAETLRRAWQRFGRAAKAEAVR
jgi:hypothetical protein